MSGSMYGRLIDRQQLRRAVGLLLGAQWAPRTSCRSMSAACAGAQQQMWVASRRETRYEAQHRLEQGGPEKWGHKPMAIFCQILTDLKKIHWKIPG